MSLFFVLDLMYRGRYISLLTAILLLVVIAPAELRAQNCRLYRSCHAGNRHSMSVDFRAGSTTIDSTYRDNRRVLESIDSLLTALISDEWIDVVAIEFCACASPEGSAEVNHRMSQGRMAAMERMVRRRLDIPDTIVERNNHYISWQHLMELVDGDATLPCRRRVLEILNGDYPEARDYRGALIDGRIPELKRLDEGRVWSAMIKSHFEHMRSAWFVVVTMHKPLMEPEPLCELPHAIRLISQPLLHCPSMAKNDRSVPLMNIKMNAVEVAAMVANIGLEWRITPRLSLDVMGHYSPYNYFSNDRKIRLLAIQPELRYWWGESLIKGHFIGLHIPVVGFNVQLNDRYRYQDPNRASWGVGLSYGYAMPLGRSRRWGVEFTIGLGYMDVTYDVYDGRCNGKYLRKEKISYVGPTRLGVNFSYRIDYIKNR